MIQNQSHHSIDQKKQSGIVIPPQEIRKLADTTAGYVAKNGASFEIMVMEKEVNNPKFCFLRKDDPYRAYYEQKITQFAKGVMNDDSKQQQQITDINQDQPNNDHNNNYQSKIEVLNPLQDKDSLLRKNKKDLKAPDPDIYTVETPKNLTLLDVDMIKCTAQFVAKNGKKFIVALTEREKNNPQFDFLKPTHDLFSYFMNLVEAYSKCLQISIIQIDKIAKNFKDKASILNNCGEIFEYENIQRMNSKTYKGEDEKVDTTVFIDWSDFVVVETIDFIDEELPYKKPMFPRPDKSDQPKSRRPQVVQKDGKLPQPLPEHENEEEGLDDVSRRPQLPEKILPIAPMKNPVSSAKESKVEPIPQRLPAEKEVQVMEGTDNVKIKTDYKPKVGKQDVEKTKCTVCGNMIPTQDLNEHLKIELMDPKYRDIKKELEDRNNWKNLIQAQDIASNLQSLAKGRPDIFGQISQFEQIEKKKLEAEQEKEKFIWDGQLPGMTRTTANIAVMQHLQKKITEQNTFPKIEKQSATIKPPIIPPNIRSNQGQEQSQSIMEEGVSLIPEDLWLKQVPQTLKISIRMPDTSQDKIDMYQMKGDCIQIQVDAKNTTMFGIKQIISSAFQNLNPQKQKLKSSLFNFLKDEKTLAYYNTRDNEIFELQILDRKI